MKWYGVMPAMTTCFDERLQVDHGFMMRHARWMLANGCTGIVSLGSLGEAATLTFAEKEAVLRNVKSAAGDAPAIAAMLTDPHLLKWSSMSEVGIDAWIAEQRAGHTVARRWLSEVPVATAPLLLDLGRKLG